MRRDYCDRCEAEVTGKKRGHVDGVEDAELDGAGEVTEEAVLCSTCYGKFRSWLKDSSLRLIAVGKPKR
jgi:hypothetical protein